MTRILVVEDEPGIALGLEDDLKLEGYDVEVIGDGVLASHRARQGGFDLILLDVMLPGKDGFEICRELRRASAPDAETECYRFGDVEVDFRRGELRRRGVPVELTPIEFKLLTLFVRAPGRLMSRDRLIEGAWGPDTFASDRIVDNHIANLRRKIEPDPADPRYIHNVRGMGYRFDG